MAASEPGGELMRLADAPPHCGDCAVFALLEDVIRAALLQGSLGRPIQAREAVRPSAGGGHRGMAGGRTGRAENDERVARIRGAMHGCLATIEDARRAISRAARFGDGVPTATMIEILHATGVIQKEVQKGREALAGVR